MVRWSDARMRSKAEGRRQRAEAIIHEFLISNQQSVISNPAEPEDRRQKTETEGGINKT